MNVSNWRWTWATLLRVGDRIDGEKIVERLTDVDGELVFVLEDGSWLEVVR